MARVVICFPVHSAFLPLNVHFCILFLVRHYVITKIYSYLIMIYCSHLFTSCGTFSVEFVHQIYTEIYQDMHLANSNKTYSKIFFFLESGSFMLTHWVKVLP